MEATVVTEAPLRMAGQAEPTVQGADQDSTTPLRQDRPNWPVCIKGAQEENSGGYMFHSLASQEKQAQTREGEEEETQSC